MKFKSFILLNLILTLLSCNNMNISQYKDHTPQLKLEEFFKGKINGWGIIQDWRGNIVKRFDVKMQGSWQGNIGRLEEDFNYYDGKKERRIWTITKLENGSYQGEAADIIDKATGKVAGNAASWQYQMDLTIDGKVFRIKFDDWMWQLNGGVVINRSYLKKFGFTIAELTLFMQKTK
jgi:hypothetical protein